ncbi:MAG: hypothetical protein HQ596_03360 [Candidatus Saganbacteria bacterium]|nr:hypothetical protein [Candidatus Saganbacteria bacterium]
MTGNTYIDLFIVLLIIIFLVIYNMGLQRKKEEEEVQTLSNVECSFCHGKDLKVKRAIKTQGWILIILGLFFTPVFGLGLIMIVWGITMKENKFHCNKCQRDF